MALRDGLQIRQRAIALQKKLGDAVRGCTQKHGRDAFFQDILLGLASEAQMSVVEMLEGDNARQITRVAWGARNLLEIYYWTRYVLRSPADAKRFHEDMICDYREMMRRLEGVAGMEPLIKVSKAAIAKLAPTFERITDSSKHLVISEIAKEFGEEKLFAMTNQLLSKYVHPTSLSVQSRLTTELYDMIAPGFVNGGAEYMEKTFPLLVDALRKEHIQAAGA